MFSILIGTGLAYSGLQLDASFFRSAGVPPAQKAPKMGALQGARKCKLL
jgi:hypothetical protein